MATEATRIGYSLEQEFEDIIKRLREPVPAAIIKQRKQGGTTMDYLEWSSVADILDRYAPGWSNSVKSVTILGKYVVVVATITIEGITRENTGIEELDAKGYGDPVSNAQAMAYKRCASMFGVGRDLYQDHSVPAILEAAEAHKERQEERKQAKPQAVATPLVMTQNQQAVFNDIKALRLQVGLNPEDLIKWAADNLQVFNLNNATPKQLESVRDWLSSLTVDTAETAATVQAPAKPATSLVDQAAIQTCRDESVRFLGHMSTIRQVPLGDWTYLDKLTDEQKVAEHAKLKVEFRKLATSKIIDFASKAEVAAPDLAAISKLGNAALWDSYQKFEKLANKKKP